MTKSEFEEKSLDWQTRMEDILVEMARTTNKDGILCYFDHVPLSIAFMEAIKELSNAYNSGVFMVRGGIGAEENEA